MNKNNVELTSEIKKLKLSSVLGVRMSNKISQVTEWNRYSCA